MEVAHAQSGSSSTWFLIALEFGNVGFWGEGKPRAPGDKPLGRIGSLDEAVTRCKINHLSGWQATQWGVSFLDDVLAHCFVCHLVRCSCSMWPFHAKGPYFNKTPIGQRCRYGSDMVCFSYIKIRIGKLTRDYHSLTQSSSFRDYTSW